MALKFSDELAALGGEFGLTPETNTRFTSKASGWAGLMKALHEAGHFDEIARKVPPPVAELMHDPPLGTTWMPHLAYLYALQTLGEIVDDDGIRAVARASVLRGVFKTMKPFVEGMSRLFGAKATKFFARSSTVMQEHVRETEFNVLVAEDNRAALEVKYLLAHSLPRAVFIYWEGVNTAVFDLCGIEAFEGKTEISKKRDSAVIHFSW